MPSLVELHAKELAPFRIEAAKFFSTVEVDDFVATLAEWAPSNTTSLFAQVAATPTGLQMEAGLLALGEVLDVSTLKGALGITRLSLAAVILYKVRATPDNFVLTLSTEPAHSGIYYVATAEATIARLRRFAHDVATALRAKSHV